MIFNFFFFNSRICGWKNPLRCPVPKQQGGGWVSTEVTLLFQVSASVSVHTHTTALGDSPLWLTLPIQPHPTYRMDLHNYLLWGVTVSRLPKESRQAESSLSSSEADSVGHSGGFSTKQVETKISSLQKRWMGPASLTLFPIKQQGRGQKRRFMGIYLCQIHQVIMCTHFSTLRPNFPPFPLICCFYSPISLI